MQFSGPSARQREIHTRPERNSSGLNISFHMGEINMHNVKRQLPPGEDILKRSRDKGLTSRVCMGLHQPVPQQKDSLALDKVLSSKDIRQKIGKCSTRAGEMAQQVKATATQA